MAWIIIISYLLIGILAVVVLAFDPFTSSFDWGLSDGYEFAWYQRYLIGLIIIAFAPYFFIRGCTDLYRAFPYAKEWKEKGTFTRKL